jgi:hypothetical protein
LLVRAAEIPQKGGWYMWRKGWKLTLFVIAVTLAMLWTPAFAAEIAEATPGSGPGMPLGPVAEWTELAPGAMRWYAFYYYQPHAMSADETVEASPVNVRMEFAPKEAGKFEVLAQEQVDLWAKGKKYTPIGQGTLSCGCKLEDSPRKINWTSEPVGHAMYYILVKNPTAQPLSYKLFIDENKYVAFPAPITTAATATAATAAAPEAAPVAAEPAAVAAAAVAPVATTPAVGEWFGLQPGEEMWFSFAYDPAMGIKRDKDPATALLTLFVEEKHPLNDIHFDVFTDAEYQELIKNGEDITGEDALKGTAVGCGTENDTLRGDFSWLGQFKSPETLHVRVRLGPNCADGLNVKLEAAGKTLQQM